MLTIITRHDAVLLKGAGSGAREWPDILAMEAIRLDRHDAFRVLDAICEVFGLAYTPLEEPDPFDFTRDEGEEGGAV